VAGGLGSAGKELETEAMRPGRALSLEARVHGIHLLTTATSGQVANLLRLHTPRVAQLMCNESRAAITTYSK
jgi:hypothetical protein